VSQCCFEGSEGTGTYHSGLWVSFWYPGHVSWQKGSGIFELAITIWMAPVCDKMKYGISMSVTTFKIDCLHLIAPPPSYIVIFWRNIDIVYTIITLKIYYFRIFCTIFKLCFNFPEKNLCLVKHTLRYGWRDVQETHINATSRQVYFLISMAHISSSWLPLPVNLPGKYELLEMCYRQLQIRLVGNRIKLCARVHMCMCCLQLGEGALEKLTEVTSEVCINISRGQDVDVYLMAK
jgi:hypothetical protein